MMKKSNEKDIPRNNERLNIKRKYNRDIKDTLQTINKKGFMSNVKLNFRNAHVAYYGKTIRPRNKNDPGLITVAEAKGINTNRYYEPPRSNIADSRGKKYFINLKKTYVMIKIKIIEQKTFDKKSNNKMSNSFVVKQISNGIKHSKEIVNHCASILMAPRTHVASSVEALSLSIKQYLLDGYSVEIPELGIFSTSISYKPVKSSKDAGVEQIEEIRINFLPCKELKEAIKKAEIDLVGIYAYVGEAAGLPNSDGSAGKSQKVYQLINKNDNYTIGEGSDNEEDDPSTDEGNTGNESGGGNDNNSGGGGFAG